MLCRLKVENYALIDSLDIELDKHLNIITGETGAGKSILLGALGLLLGNKNESGTIHDESRSCIIEGEFDLRGYNLEPFFEDNDLDYEQQCVIRRMILPSGKSRSFVNDVPVQLTLLKELGYKLIDIHSQHRNMLLSDEQFRISAVDTIAGAKSLVEEYQHKYRELRSAERVIENLRSEAEALRKDEEWLRFQVAEFEAAALKEGELKEAEEELKVLENADQIGEALISLRNALDAEQVGVLEQLALAQNSFARLAEGYPLGAEFAERIKSVVAELKDLGRTATDESERIEADPERLQKLTDRVNLIYSMCQKHRAQDLSELIAKGNGYAEQLSAITHSDENILAQQAKIDELYSQAKAIADQIHALREKAAVEISKHIEDTLSHLGMPQVRFTVEVESQDELLSTGCDKVRFMFSSNEKLTAQAVEKIASGGEISRVMLALKALLASKSQLPTIIFDEIDTGVSGRIADAMGEIIESLSSNMQVVSITHLPQVASKGESHFVVYKQNSVTNIARLDAEQRVEEIAKMLSGSVISAAALEQARLLLGK
ncbi:MAG: DNA repair protein RecN [Alistipes sp.]|nr:DNA repair protein RecN [Alistipes sp.]